MSIPFNATLTGTFTSNGTSQLVTVSPDIVKFEVFNETQFGSSAGTTPMIRAQWIRDLADGSGFLDAKTNGAATVQITQMITSNGFTLNNPLTRQPVGPAVTGTVISQAAPASVSMNSHGYNTGDVVRIINSTGMLQVSGIEFSITRTGANSFTLTNLDSSGFAAAATAVTARKINGYTSFYPYGNFVTNISAASNARVTLAVTHGLTVGQMVRVSVPSQFGMTQMNGLSGRIVAINTADASGFTNTIDLDINSSAFTAFSFPTSAIAAAGTSFPTCVSIGEAAVASVANSLDDATRNTTVAQMLLGSSVVGGSSDVVRWVAYRALG